MRHFRRAVTLIELLVCLAIIMILNTIAIVSYKGAADSQFLKLEMPGIIQQINDLARYAHESKVVVEIEFPQGQEDMIVTIKRSGAAKTERVGVRRQGSGWRGLDFQRYRWPDGSTEPRTFTFSPNGSPEGGTLWVGSGFAEAHMGFENGRLTWEMN